MSASAEQSEFDAIIVGSGIAGALTAKRLGLANRRVLILEAGAEIPVNLNEDMRRFYLASAKVPESPYTPEFLDPQGRFIDPQEVNAGRPTSLNITGIWKDPHQSYLVHKSSTHPFASTYERVAGGTSRHWLGTCLRLLPADFKMGSTYQTAQLGLVDWPIGYADLMKYYEQAEDEIGVSANVADQEFRESLFPTEYSYPMPAIPQSMVDTAVAGVIDQVRLPDHPAGLKVSVTPAARNSQPFRSRRVCAGNTNCIPICPIQAKYDPTITLNEALNARGPSGKSNVDIRFRSVASKLLIGEDGRITGVEYINYKSDRLRPQGAAKTATAKIYIVAANAIETPRLLLMSGAATQSGAVGRYLMDHPFYVAWALMPKEMPVWPYRGPLSTSGIESARDGIFRSTRAAFRIEIGNEGWNFVVGGDPNVTTVDFVTGLNRSGANPKNEQLFGGDLVTRLGDVLTRQIRLGFLVEQTPDSNNRVMLADETDGLGLPRPEIQYDLSPYTKAGLAMAQQTATNIFEKLSATEATAKADPASPLSFEWPLGSGNFISFLGAGHIAGTCRMGNDHNASVVDRDLRCHEHKNLFLIGSSVFPTIATANPTLTIAALALRAADTINQDLARGG